MQGFLLGTLHTRSSLSPLVDTHMTGSRAKIQFLYARKMKFIFILYCSDGLVVKVLSKRPEGGWFKPHYYQVAIVGPLNKAFNSQIGGLGFLWEARDT